MHRSCAPFVITTIKNSCHCYPKFLPLAVSELLLGSSELDLEQQFLNPLFSLKDENIGRGRKDRLGNFRCFSLS